MKFTLFLRKTDSERDTRFSLFDRNHTGDLEFIDIEAATIEEAKEKATLIIADRITERFNFDEARLFTQMEEQPDLIRQGNDIFMERWHAKRKEDMKKQLAYLKKELGEE